MSSGKYDDIINMKRPISRNHKPMSLYERSAQFAPFAALTGHEAAIAKTASIINSEWQVKDALEEESDL